MCCDQNVTSILKPIQCTAISIPLVTGSFLPTRSNTILIVDCKFDNYKLFGIKLLKIIN